MIFPKISLVLLTILTNQQVQSACIFKTCKLTTQKCLRTGKWKFCSPAALEKVCGTPATDCKRLWTKVCDDVKDLDCDSIDTKKGQKGCRAVKNFYECDTQPSECTEDCPYTDDKLAGIKKDASSSVDEKDLWIAFDRISMEEYELMLKFTGASSPEELIRWEWDSSLNSYLLKRKLTSTRLDRVEFDSVKAEAVDDTTDFSSLKDDYGSYQDHLNLRASAEFFEQVLLVIKDGEDNPVNVYAPDTRYTYRDTSYPWSTVGRVATTGGGACTGTMVGRNLMLTASHCMQWNTDGTVGAFSFTPAFYNGDAPFGTAWATRVFYWNQASGGLSDLESGYDYVVAVLNSDMGDLTGYAGYKVYSSSWSGGN